MAYGDPMTFETENLTIYGGFETDGGTPSGVALGWTGYKTVDADYTPTVETSGQYSGAGCQKIRTSGSAGTGDVGIFSDIDFLGDPNLDAWGHKGATIRVSLYMKAKTAGKKVWIRLEEYNSSDVCVKYHTGEEKTLTTSWANYYTDFVIDQATTRYVRIVLRREVKMAEDEDFYFDALTITERLAVATNPVNEDSDLGMKEAFERGRNNTGYFQRNAATQAKRSGALTFIDIWDNLKLLRSLWLWGKLVTWYPYLYNLPTSLNVYFIGKWKEQRLQQNDALYSTRMAYEEQ